MSRVAKTKPNHIDIVAFNEPHVLTLTQKMTKSRHEYAPTSLMIYSAVGILDSIQFIQWTHFKDGKRRRVFVFFFLIFFFLFTIYLLQTNFVTRCGEPWESRAKYWINDVSFQTCQNVLTLQLPIVSHSAVHVDMNLLLLVFDAYASAFTHRLNLILQSWIECDGWEGVAFSLHSHRQSFEFILFYFHFFFV